MPLFALDYRREESVSALMLKRRRTVETVREALIECLLDVLEMATEELVDINRDLRLAHAAKLCAAAGPIADAARLLTPD